MSWLHDPEAVAEQYSTDGNLQARRALYQDVEGENAPDVLWRVLEDLQPQRVLEVGGGPGELAERIQRELAAEVTYVDISPHMVMLASARGVRAQEGDAQDLPFRDGSFDLAVAAWMLYHVQDVNRGLAEIARVLVEGGTLVAVTNSVEHLAELRELMQYERPHWAFSRENGEEYLRRHFRHVERLDADVKVTVRTREPLVAYQQSMPIVTSPIPENVDLPFVTYGRPTIFIATK